MGRKSRDRDNTTRERILDWAERLFAQKGVKGTSVRELCAKAGVNVGAVSYYFDSKEGLVKAVLSRRLDPLNQARRDSLEELLSSWRKGGRRPEVEEVVRAFVGPAFELLHRNDSASHFVSLLGRAFADPDPTVKRLFLEKMAPVFLLLLETMSAALPDLPEERLFWRLHFMIGSMGHILAGRFPSGTWSGTGWEWLDGFDPGAVDVQEELVAFVTAGLEAL